MRLKFSVQEKLPRWSDFSAKVNELGRHLVYALTHVQTLQPFALVLNAEKILTQLV